ncbi:MAG: hypothetical protein ABIP85_24335 [Chthoniobacteraceae bacterium]
MKEKERPSAIRGLVHLDGDETMLDRVGLFRPAMTLPCIQAGSFGSRKNPSDPNGIRTEEFAFKAEPEF